MQAHTQMKAKPNYNNSTNPKKLLRSYSALKGGKIYLFNSLFNFDGFEINIMQKFHLKSRWHGGKPKRKKMKFHK